MRLHAAEPPPLAAWSQEPLILLPSPPPQSASAIPSPQVGAIKAPSNFDESRLGQLATAPDSRLEMAWVHGYRCRDAYNNIAVLPGGSGEVVWPAAATGVVYDPGAHTQRHFVGHPDDVRSLALSPAGDRVATGGQGRRPEVVVWDPATCTEVARFDGEERAPCFCFVGVWHSFKRASCVGTKKARRSAAAFLGSLFRLLLFPLHLATCSRRRAGVALVVISFPRQGSPASFHLSPLPPHPHTHLAPA